MPTARLQALEELASGSADQVTLAVQIVERDRDLETVLAALRALVDARPLDPAVRPPLLKRFVHDQSNGPRRDAGGHVRAGILDALRGNCTRDDVTMLEDAVLTHEEIRAVEVAGRLRAHALLALDDVDDELASFHAVRLLLDAKATDPTNESAMTAVGVLAGRERLRPLYLFAITGEGHPLVVSECLRRLTALPASLVPTLVARHAESKSGVVSVGLLDLLIQHDAWLVHRSDIAAVLATLPDNDAHYYAVTATVASRRPELIGDLVALAREEKDADRLRNYVDALALRDFDEGVTEAVAELRLRLP